MKYNCPIHKGITYESVYNVGCDLQRTRQSLGEHYIQTLVRNNNNFRKLNRDKVTLTYQNRSIYLYPIQNVIDSIQDFFFG